MQSKPIFSQQQEQKTVDWQGLFKFMENIHKMSEQIPEYATVLVGMSRSGKSTIFNWSLCKQSLIGKIEGVNNYYDFDTYHSKSKPRAEIGNTYSSVTLMPNVAKIKEGSKEGMLIDFGGFGQRRGAFDVLKVNYSLAAFLLKMKKIRFVLTIGFNAFRGFENLGFRTSVHQFLSLFHFDLMEKEDMEQLFNSVSICVTSVPHDKSQEDILNQLRININNLKKLGQTNEEYRKEDQFCEQFLTNIWTNRRISSFPQAKVGKHPELCTVFNEFIQNSWRYCSFKDSIKDAIAYPYARQFQLLSQTEKELLRETIIMRFQKLQELSDIYSSILKAVSDSLCQKQFDVSQWFEQLESFVKDHQFYNGLKDIASQQYSVQVKVNYSQASLVDRLNCLRRIFNYNLQVKDFSIWKGEKQEQSQANSQLKQKNGEQKVERQYQFLNLSEFYSELFELFLNKQNLLSKVIGYEKLSDKQRKLMRQSLFVVEKNLDQAVIFQNLNRFAESGSESLNSVVRTKIIKGIAFGDESFSSIESLETSFIEQIHSRIKQLPETEDTEKLEIIKEIKGIEQKNKQVDSAQVYEVVHQLYLQIGVWRRQQSKHPRDICQMIIFGLVQTLKYGCCLAIKRNQVDEKLKLLQYQRKFLEKMVDVLLMVGKDDVAQNCCDLLKQYSLKSYVFAQLLQRRSVNLEHLKQFADHHQRMGLSHEALKKYREYSSKTGRDTSAQVQLISREPHDKSFQRRQKCQEQQAQLSSQAILKVVNIVGKTFGLQPIELNFEQERNRYQSRKKGSLNYEQLLPEIPSNPKSYQYLQHSEQIIELRKGKKITVVIGGKGQTTLTYALAGFKLKIKTSGNGFCYELLENAINSKINEDGHHPTEYPYFLPVLQSQEEWLVDFVGIFSSKDSRSILSHMLLETMLQKSGGFRFMLVLNEGDFRLNQFDYLLKLLKMLIVGFRLTTLEDPLTRRVGDSLYLAITFSTDIPYARQSLKRLVTQLKSPEMVVDNEQRYNLIKEEQVICAKLLDMALKKIFYFDYPKGNENNYSISHSPFDLIKQEMCVDVWSYMLPGELSSSFSRRMVEGMKVGRITHFAGEIKKNIDLLSSIFWKLYGHITSKYEAFIHRSEQIEDNFYQQIKEEYNIAEIEQNFAQPIHRYAKTLKIVKQMLQLRHSNTLKKIAQDIFCPQTSQQYSITCSALIQCSSLLFRNCKSLCCTNNSERGTLASLREYVQGMLVELQKYSQHFGDCEIDQIRSSINDITNVTNFFLSLSDQFSESVTYFKQQCCLEEIQDIPSASSQLQCIRQYEGVIEQIQSQMESADGKWIRQKKVAAVKVRIRVYEQLGNEKEKIIGQFQLIEALRESMPANQKMLSFQQQCYKEEVFYQIGEFLWDWGRKLVFQNQKVALRIGYFLGNKNAKQLLEILIKKEINNQKRKDYLVMLIDVSLKLGEREIVINRLLRELQSILPPGFPRQNLSTKERVQSYYRQYLSPEVQAKESELERIFDFALSLKSTLLP